MAAGTKSRFNPVWLQGLACGAVVALATPTALLLALMLVPTGMAFLLDPRPERPAARPVLLFGLAATLPSLLVLWRGGHSIDLAFSLCTDVSVLGVAWASQAAGWLLAEIAPLCTRLALDARSAARTAKLRAARARFEADWGIPPPEGSDVSAESSS